MRQPDGKPAREETFDDDVEDQNQAQARAMGAWQGAFVWPRSSLVRCRQRPRRPDESARAVQS
ncbi:hypothetical protein SBV1_890025 [Verrucomicrobia bacterium]|nr:hypothetical protein SBV1_890025 [Verrucomicrobiota bacterium]